MSDATALRRTVVYRALQRPNLVLGGERELVLTALLVSGALIVAGMNLPSTIVGVCLYFSAVAALRALAKSDPFMSHVYRRHLRYQRYYAATPSVWAK